MGAPDWEEGSYERTAAQLLEVARAQAAQNGLACEFLNGRAEALPVEDGWADVVVSSFGVIFAAALLDERNEGPGGFRVTSRYAVVTARRA